jgi:hypothetical protein
VVWEREAWENEASSLELVIARNWLLDLLIFTARLDILDQLVKLLLAKLLVLVCESAWVRSKNAAGDFESEGAWYASHCLYQTGLVVLALDVVGKIIAPRLGTMDIWELLDLGTRGGSILEDHTLARSVSQISLRRNMDSQR